MGSPLANVAFRMQIQEPSPVTTNGGAGWIADLQSIPGTQATYGNCAILGIPRPGAKPREMFNAWRP
jgi:hypothetical protein